MSTDEEKRRLILCYREIIEDAMEVQEQTERNRESVVRINNVMDRAEELVNRVNTSDEAVLDAKVISISSAVLKQHAETFDTNLRSYDMDVFCNHTIQFLDGADGVMSQGAKSDWKKLAPFAKKCFRFRTPSLACMLGTFQMGEVPLPPKRVRIRRENMEEARKKQPENVAKLEKEEDGIEETVQHIFKILVTEWKKKKCKPLCYFTFVVNPESFGATVENIFHVSFLIKGGLVELKYDENEFPVIEPVTEQQKKANPPSEKRQVIISIDMEEWEELIDTFKITRPKITPRNVK